MADRTIVLDVPILDNEIRNEFSYIDLVESHLVCSFYDLHITEKCFAKFIDEVPTFSTTFFFTN